jgi:hypothetical protein
MESILIAVKTLLGLDTDYTHFDPAIVMNINTVFLTLRQIGMGPEQGFFITDETSKWEDFVTDPFMQESVKTYVYLKVRLMFDPPETSYLITSIKNQILELEWRFQVQASLDNIQEV